jgi:hypothetical protein
MAGSAAGSLLLRTACESPAASPGTITLADLHGVALDGVAEVHPRRRPRPGRLQLVGQPRQSAVFDGTAEQWQTRARLLDPLIDQPGTGYQYLDYDRTGDAIVIAERTT